MELNHLRVFFEVAKVGRFNEAARKLSISQSALSRSVALLEESEGVQLFERSKKGVALTVIGEEVFRRCEEMFRTFHEIEGICRGTRETCEGLLSIGTTDHVINDLLTPPILAFREKFPKVIPSVVTGTPDEIASAVVNSYREFGLLFVRVPMPQLKYEMLRTEQMALVCQPALWQKARSSSTTKTLHNVLREKGYISSVGAHLQTRLSVVMQELFGELPRIGFEANGQETQKRVCLAGGGVAYLSRFMVRKEIEAGTLHEIPIDTPHSFNLWLVTRKGHSLTLTARTFLGHLKHYA